MPTRSALENDHLGTTPQTWWISRHGAKRLARRAVCHAARRGPIPTTTTEGVGRLQTAFFNIALNGGDQLRQRGLVRPGTDSVASAVKDVQFEQMVSYQRFLATTPSAPTATC